MGDYPVMCISVYLSIVMYCERFVVVYMESAVLTNILTHVCTLASVCEVSNTNLLGCLRYKEKHGKDILISCGCVLLFTDM